MENLVESDGISNEENIMHNNGNLFVGLSYNRLFQDAI